MSEFQGIDVSRHQGTIDWQKVKAAGKQFAFIRLGWCGYDGRIQENNGLDSNFAANIQGATNAGLAVGVYVYCYARTALAASRAARETLELISPYQITYPVVLDLEDTSDTGTRYDLMTVEENTAIANSFLTVLEQAGYYSMLYTYKSFAENFLDMKSLSRFDFWLAQIAPSPTYTGSYGIWQYSWTGKVSGISTDVDLNIAYKDYASIIQEQCLNNLCEDSGNDGNDDDDNGEDDGGNETDGNCNCEALVEENAQLKAELKKIKIDISNLSFQYPPN